MCLVSSKILQLQLLFININKLLIYKSLYIYVVDSDTEESSGSEWEEPECRAPIEIPDAIRYVHYVLNSCVISHLGYL